MTDCQVLYLVRREPREFAGRKKRKGQQAAKVAIGQLGVQTTDAGVAVLYTFLVCDLQMASRPNLRISLYSGVAHILYTRQHIDI